MMDFLDLVKNAIQSNALLRPGEPVIVAFSGGADSSALVMALSLLGYPVHAVHVEHGIRGEESLRDASFAEDFCRERSLPFTLLHCDAPGVSQAQRLSLEDAARRERYRLLEEISQREHKRIAVAHHLDDQAETVLMHLLRGSGLAGLGGMSPKNGNIIRPFLDISKDQILQFVQEQHIPFIHDSSNEDVSFMRNRLRKTVMPPLLQIRPDAAEKIADCAKILRAWQTHENELSKMLFSRFALISENKVVLPRLLVDDVTIYELSRHALIALKSDVKDVTGAHFRAIADLWQKPSGSVVTLPGDLRVRRSFEQIEFFYPNFRKEYRYSFEPCRHYEWNGKTIKSRFVFSLGNKKGTYLDFDALPPDTQLRTRQSGDRFHPLGAPGSMTLKKFFINKKIPQDVRETIPLLASGNEVLAIFGVTVAEKAKVTDQTKRILYIFEGEPL